MQVHHKAESPREVGGMSVDFVIHQIADADECAHQCDRYHEPVERPQGTFLCHEYREQHHRNHQADCAAMRGKSALPCVENLDGMPGIIVPCIKEHMTQTGPYNGGDNYVNQKYAEPFFRGAFMTEYAFHNFVA